MPDKTVHKLGSSPTTVNRSHAKLHFSKLGMLEQSHKDWLENALMQFSVAYFSLLTLNYAYIEQMENNIANTCMHIICMVIYHYG